MNLAFIFLSLFGCYDNIELSPKHPPTATPTPEYPELQEGGYELQIVQVNQLQCQGMRPADLLGEELWVDLGFTDRGIELDLDGIMLHGPMKDGLLSAHGSDSISYDSPDDPPPEQNDAGADTGSSDAGAQGPAAQMEVALRLDMSIVSDRMAMGAFSYAMTSADYDCTLEADVAMLFVGEASDKVVAEEDADDESLEEVDTGAAE